jgi:hypothetical protein
MNTILKAQPGFVGAYTSKVIKQVPPGKVWLVMARIEVVELDGKPEDQETKFAILAAVPNLIEERTKANLMRFSLKEIGKHIESNRANLEAK